MGSNVRTAIIPAGGLGTRLMPLTRAVPKELLPVWKKPVLQYAVEEAAEAGIERIVIVTSPGKDSLERHFGSAWQAEITALHGRDGPHIEFVIQEKALGLGHAIRLAAPRAEAVAVLLPDEFLLGENCLQQLIAYYKERPGSVLAVQKVPLADVRRYGIVDVATADGYGLDVKALVEKPQPENAPSQLAIIGRYVLDPSVIDKLQDAAPSLGGEIQLTDSIAGTCGHASVTAVHYDGQRFDCGTFQGLLQANVAVAQMEEPTVLIQPAAPARQPLQVDAA
ncbi:MAG: sugar phosphate nucleotidyltransferase [Dongiaceae bacterium]